MKNMKKIAVLSACAVLAGSMTAGAVRFPIGVQVKPIIGAGTQCGGAPSDMLGQLLGQLCKPENRPNCDGNHRPDFPNLRPDLPDQLPAPDGGNVPDFPSLTPDAPGQLPAPDGEGVPVPPIELPNAPEISSQAAEVVRLVNAERAKAGLAALTADTKASSAARVRAGELAQSFSHTRPNGAAFGSALTEAGASFRSSGENIAYGQQNAAAVMQTWMNSAGHRANILSEKFTSIGVGHTVIGGVSYWTQLFIG